VLQRDLWKKREKASAEKVIAAGTKLNEIPDKSGFQAAMKPVYEKYLEDNPDLRPLVELIQATP
jgi:TRAP-type C4-dicarboxylate transport system substrate-binding protein